MTIRQDRLGKDEEVAARVRMAAASWPGVKVRATSVALRRVDIA